MSTFGMALAGFLILAEQDTIVITTGMDYTSTKYHQTDYESACGSTVFQVRFRNGEENGRVDYLLVDGRPVPGAAELLDLRAARRMINSITIVNCGMDPRRPVFVGMLSLEPMESRRLGMRWSLVFRLAREGRGDWRMTIE
jgi:hypothetical protein